MSGGQAVSDEPSFYQWNDGKGYLSNIRSPLLKEISGSNVASIFKQPPHKHKTKRTISVKNSIIYRDKNDRIRRFSIDGKSVPVSTSNFTESRLAEVSLQSRIDSSKNQFIKNIRTRLQKGDATVIFNDGTIKLARLSLDDKIILINPATSEREVVSFDEYIKLTMKATVSYRH